MVRVPRCSPAKPLPHARISYVTEKLQEHEAASGMRYGYV
jgi:hypothetical protein